MQAGHTCVPSGRFLQVSPAGIFSILRAQHVSGLGSSCRSSQRLLEVTLGLLLWSPSHVIFNFYGPHIILCSTEVVP